MPGLGGEVLRRLGATVVNLPGGEIVPALRSGAIDASEWVGPWDDMHLGLHKASIQRTRFIGLRRFRMAKDLRRSAGRAVSSAALNSAKSFLISKMHVEIYSIHMGRHRPSTSCQNAVPTYCECGWTIRRHSNSLCDRQFDFPDHKRNPTLTIPALAYSCALRTPERGARRSISTSGRPLGQSRLAGALRRTRHDDRRRRLPLRSFMEPSPDRRLWCAFHRPAD
jgi:hypothetical protein